MKKTCYTKPAKAIVVVWDGNNFDEISTALPAGTRLEAIRTKDSHQIKISFNGGNAQCWASIGGYIVIEESAASHTPGFFGRVRRLQIEHAAGVLVYENKAAFDRENIIKSDDIDSLKPFLLTLRALEKR